MPETASESTLILRKERAIVANYSCKAKKNVQKPLYQASNEQIKHI